MGLSGRIHAAVFSFIGVLCTTVQIYNTNSPLGCAKRSIPSVFAGYDDVPPWEWREMPDQFGVSDEAISPHVSDDLSDVPGIVVDHRGGAMILAFE